MDPDQKRIRYIRSPALSPSARQQQASPSVRQQKWDGESSHGLCKVFFKITFLANLAASVPAILSLPAGGGARSDDEYTEGMRPASLSIFNTCAAVRNTSTPADSDSFVVPDSDSEDEEYGEASSENELSAEPVETHGRTRLQTRAVLARQKKLAAVTRAASHTDGSTGKEAVLKPSQDLLSRRILHLPAEKHVVGRAAEALQR